MSPWRLIVAFGVALLVALPAAAQGKDEPWPTHDWQTSTPEAQGMSARELEGLVTFGIGNGFDSVLVTRHGRIVTEAYYAPFPAGLKHRVNSATKSVVGSLIAIALKEGTLKSLDQPVLEFFPDRTFAETDARKKALTPRSLLDMTSGIDWDEPLRDAPPWSMIYMERSPDWVKYILDHRMVAEPGTVFAYNSGNTHLLSAILSKVIGQSAADYAHDKLFGPLGIDDVSWRRDPQGISTGGFGLYLQPRDMAKLGYLWLRGGLWEGQRILPAEWTEQARKAPVPMGLGPLLHYGNAFWSMPKQDIFMAVGFDRQLIVVMPKLDIVAVFTGAMRYSNAQGALSMPRYRFPDVLERLQAAVKSDGPIDADAAASADLAAAVAKVAQEVRTPAAKRSPMESQVSGKIYRLAANELRLESFSLTFEDGKASYAFDTQGQRWGGPIGLDGHYAIGGRRPYGTSAAKGTWLDDRTFQLEAQTVGNDDAALATLKFDGKNVEMNTETLLRLKFAFKGTAED